MSQALSQESSLQESFNALWHSRTAQALAMSVALVASAINCSGSSDTELRAQQPSPTLTTGEGSLPQPGTTTGTLPLTTTSTEALTTTTTTPPDAIRQVDANNVLLEPDACQNTAMTWPSRLDGGRGMQKNGSSNAYVSILDNVEVAYGDLTNDGVDEMIVPLKCTPDSAAITYPLVAYSLQDGVSKQLGVVGAGDKSDIVHAKPTAVHIKDQKVVVDGYYFADTDLAYSPTRQATTNWRWDGSHFALDGSPQIHTPNPTQDTTPESTPLVNQPANQVSVDGIGPIALGMTESDVIRAGYTKNTTPGCGMIVNFNGGAGPLSVTFDSEGKINAIQVDDPAYKTPSGVAPGSPESAVTKAYGNNLQVTQMPGNTGPFQVDVFKGPKAIEKGDRILFSIIGGVVKFETLVPAVGDGPPSRGPLLC